MRETLKEANKLFSKWHTKDPWKDLRVNTRNACVRLFHNAQALQEVMRYFGEDTVTVAKSIPPNQSQSDKLEDTVRSSPGSANAKPSLHLWTVKALLSKNSDFAKQSGPSQEHAINASALESENEQEDGDLTRQRDRKGSRRLQPSAQPHHQRLHLSKSRWPR